MSGNTSNRGSRRTRTVKSDLSQQEPVTVDKKVTSLRDYQKKSSAKRDHKPLKVKAEVKEEFEQRSLEEKPKKSSTSKKRKLQEQPVSTVDKFAAETDSKLLGKKSEPGETKIKKSERVIGDGPASKKLKKGKKETKIDKGITGPEHKANMFVGAHVSAAGKNQTEVFRQYLLLLITLSRWITSSSNLNLCL